MKMEESHENNNDAVAVRKKNKKGQESDFPEIDKETFEYFQRVKDSLDNQEFQDDEENSKKTLVHFQCDQIWRFFALWVTFGNN